MEFGKREFDIGRDVGIFYLQSDDVRFAAILHAGGHRRRTVVLALRGRMQERGHSRFQFAAAIELLHSNAQGGERVNTKQYNGGEFLHQCKITEN